MKLADLRAGADYGWTRSTNWTYYLDAERVRLLSLAPLQESYDFARGPHVEVTDNAGVVHKVPAASPANQHTPPAARRYAVQVLTEKGAATSQYRIVALRSLIGPWGEVAAQIKDLTEQRAAAEAARRQAREALYRRVEAVRAALKARDLDDPMLHQRGSSDTTQVSLSTLEALLGLTP
jgi:hypothetical protein